MTLEALLHHFREQVQLCHGSGSSFTAQLIERVAQDLEAGGPVADLVADWPRNPRADALAVGLTGALHAAALTGRDRALAAEYPAPRRDWSMDALWPLARALLARESAWVAGSTASPGPVPSTASWPSPTATPAPSTLRTDRRKAR